jgi:hypothetical protein
VRLTRTPSLGGAWMGLLVGCLLGPVWAQTTPPRTYAWSETMVVPEGEEIGAPSAVATAPGPEILLADGLDRPRLLLFGKQGVSWQLQRVIELPAVARSLAFDGERWIGSLAGGDGLTAFNRDDLSASKIPLPPEVVAGVIAATPRGKLLISDLASQRVVQLDKEGAMEREAELEGFVTGLAADWSGGFVSALADQGRIVRFDSNWTPMNSWELPADEGKPAWPVDLVIDEGGRTTILDRHSGRLLELDSAGRWVGLGSRRGWEAGLLFLPSSLARLPDGRIVVADEGNGRVQIFRPVGTGN